MALKLQAPQDEIEPAPQAETPPASEDQALDAAVQAAVEPAPQEPSKPSEPIKFEAAPVSNQERLQEERAQKARDFTEKVMAARRHEEVVHRPQPVAPLIQERTSQEMEAGRRMNEVHATRTAIAPRRIISAAEAAAQGKNTPVFRPSDYVPDPKKGQGTNLQARNL